MVRLLLFEMIAGPRCTATNLIGFALYYNMQFDDRLLGKKGVAEGREDLCLIHSGIEECVWFDSLSYLTLLKPP